MNVFSSAASSACVCRSTNNSNGHDLGLGGSPNFVSGSTFQAKASRGYDFRL